MKYRILLSLMLPLYYGMLIGQSSPTFTTFKGKVYALDYREIKKGYGKHIYDSPVIGEIEWESINIPDRHISDGFPDVERTQMFGIELFAKMTIDEKSCYEFILTSDDGSGLWIDEQIVVGNGGTHEMTEKRDTIQLDKGTYDIKLWYYQAYPDRYGFIFDSNNVGLICEKIIAQKKTVTPTISVKEEKITLTSEVFFDVNQYLIKSSAANQLNEVCQQIKNKKPKKITVVGHTDDRGTNEHNLILSQNRAKAIRDFLMSKINLVDVAYVIKGIGENQPIASNDTEEGRRENRRVEIIIE